MRKEIILNKYIFYVVIFLGYSGLKSQVYTEKRTKHRFAQLNFGIDYQTNFGGSTQFLNENGSRESLELKSLHKPRLLLGGTHFWGHVDLYIAIPVFNQFYKERNQEILYQNGVETVLKYYPYRIENKKIRPFMGVSFAPYYYEQNNMNFEFGNGPELNHTSVPIMAGFTYNAKNSLFEIGVQWNYNNKQEYYISRNDFTTISTPPLYANFSYRYMLDTTLSAEENWESGKTQETTEKLSKEKKLNGLYLGVGLSSAFWLGKSSYNKLEYPFLEKYSTSVIPEFTLGYYWHKPDLNLSVNHKGYSSSLKTYGVNQVVRRKSIGVELTKFVVDYKGFAAFIGPTASYEKLTFKESFEKQLTQDIGENQIGYGLTFGWDIRPNQIQKWILRTNLRWFPNLKLDVENNQVSFNAFEFNFIQFILFPERLFGNVL